MIRCLIFLSTLLLSPLFSVTFDKALLRHDYYSYKELEPFDSPYIVIYKKDAKELRFIAAKHAAGIESPTFQTIRETVNAFQPEVVIVEGLPSSLGLSSPHFIEVGLRNFKEDFQSCGESIYALYLAHCNNFAFIGGEPDDEYIFKKSSDHGHSPQDLLGFYLVRQVPQWRREGLLEESFEALAEAFIHRYQEKLQIAEYKIQDFYSWYREKTGCFFDVEEINLITSIPLEEGTFLQKMSWENIALRDAHLQQIMEQILNQFDRVLVVYGSWHAVVHRGALEEYFGHPKFFKLVNIDE